jgi:hypothetical protein
MPLALAFLLTLTAPAGAADWDAYLNSMPQPVLNREYHPTCQSPCQYIGFPFTYTDPEHAAIRLTGANMLGLGAMWSPVMDPDAPYGCGTVSPEGAGVLAQTFMATEPFDRVAPSLPTSTSTDSGCSWALYESTPEDALARLVASGLWPALVDNAFVEAAFGVQPPGRYALQISQATGSWVGWWARTDNPYPDGEAWEAGAPRSGLDLELRIGLGAQSRYLVPPNASHMAMRLGPSGTVTLRRHDLVANYSVGDWNNPGFPYMPDWFNERFPDALAVDQNGNRIMGGMFDKLVPAPGIEAPVLVDGASRFIREVVRRVGDDARVVYWVMGGEDMYATYSYGAQWTDYSDRAIRHFQQWLSTYRYPSVAELNAAWGSTFASFSAVDPPRAPAVSRAWLDWLDFRFQSMGERFAWHYRAARSQDPSRLIVSCNHGTLYADNTYAAMGARPELYAANSDGYETGQIMGDDDPELYNIMYMETLNGLGKPYCPARLAYRKTNPKARGGGTSYTPQAARRYVYETLGGDAWHLGLIQWSGSLPDGEWGVVGTPAETEIAKLYGELFRLRPQLADMHAIRPRLAVFLSHPTWALRGFSPEWTAFHVAAVASQVPKLYLYDEQLKSGQLGPDQTVLSMDNSILDPAVLRALLAHARAGGRVIIAGRFADEDADGRRVTGPTVALRAELLRRATCQRSTDPAAILKALGSAVQPVALSSRDTAPSPQVMAVAPRGEDWAQDMREATSLGQLIRLPYGGLLSLSIRTPTYYHKPEFGFRLEALLGGPEGQVIASREVPGDIADNSWQELAIPEPPPAGATLYIRATADPRLPASNIGWWSTHQDVQPAASAYVDDRPVPGDRQVILTFARAVPANQRVEAFILSDGLNYGVVLISLAPMPIALQADLCRLVPGGAYTVSTPLHPAQWQGRGLAGTVSLPANGTAFVYLERKVSSAEAASLVVRAEAAADAWRQRQALTTYAAYAVSRAREQVADAHQAKAAAMALNTLAQVGLNLSVDVQPSGGLHIEGTCYDSAGKPAPVDRALCQFVPTPAFWRPAPVTGPGRFALDLRRSDLPPMWDYAAGRYTACSGPLRVQVSVTAGDRHTQALQDVTITRTAGD